MGTVPQTGRVHPVQLHLPELRTPLQADLPGGDRQLQAVRMPEKASGTVRNVRIFPKTYLRQHRTIASADLSGSFAPFLQFQKREIHTVFPDFPNFLRKQNLSLSALADLIRAS